MPTTNAFVAPWEDSGGSDEPGGFDELNQFADPEDEPVSPEKEMLIDEIASEFVGSWNLLVSQTNWEKGKVVHEWRMKLTEAGLPRRVYSDDAISQRIGGVSPQHVGRLRRVYERFGKDVATNPLPNLYWSHYQAALDWEDAEEWLKKASDEKLSVAQTRVARWEKYGAPQSRKPKDSDIVVEERDADVNPYNDSNAEIVSPDVSNYDEPITPTKASIEGSDEDKKKKKKNAKNVKNEDPLGEFSGDAEPWETESGAGTSRFTTAEVLDAIAQLEPLPGDLAEAFESLKVAILTRRIENWVDVQPVLIAAYLSEMKRLLVSEEK